MINKNIEKQHQTIFCKPICQYFNLIDLYNLANILKYHPQNIFL